MQEVEIQAAPLHLLADILSPERAERLRTAAARGRDLLAGRVVWNVNATRTAVGSRRC